MPGRTALQKEIPDLWLLHGKRIHPKRDSACISEQIPEIRFEILIAMAHRFPPNKAYFASGNNRPISPGPLLVRRLIAAGKMKYDPTFLVCLKEVLCANTNDCIGTLLQIPIAYIQINYAILRGLISL